MEGPSIIILKEQVKSFQGKKILNASGNAKIDFDLFRNEKILDFKSWGKHFLICFPSFYVRIHFLMFGSYRINETRTLKPRLSLQFKNGSLNFYTCSIKIFEGDPNDIYDWEADVLSDKWNTSKALRKLKKLPDTMVCDAILDQNIFAGAGNIIKNEVLFRIKIHPESLIKNLPTKKLKELVDEVRNYSFDFLKWKKLFQLKKHWLIYSKKKCPECGGPVIKKSTGITKRRSFYCRNDQKLFT